MNILRNFLRNFELIVAILFELLYKNVFGMDQAVSQAAEMINTKSYRYRKDSYSSCDNRCVIYG